LAERLQARPDVDLRLFSWRYALTGRYDVFHAHWPEILVSGQSPVKKAVRQLLFLGVLAKWRREGTAVVRTQHNLDPPQGISRRERLLLRLFERRTNLVIRLNTSTPVPTGVLAETVVHGHYRTWFERYPPQPSVPGRIAYVGLVRRYKGVDRLVEAFAETSDPSLSLTVGGKPSSVELRDALVARAATDPRIRLDLRFLDDAELVAAVTSASLVVLPYLEMHNSGTALMTLSLDRPVLLPDNDVNQQLRAEVGEDWVHLYAGPLTADVLEATLRTLQRPSTARPDLSRREWSSTAADHRRAYEQAVAVAGSRHTA
jgi:glycosyltransferase involved in cell wall biosynthesis